MESGRKEKEEGRENKKGLTFSRRAFSTASTSFWLTKFPAPPRPPDLRMLDIVSLARSLWSKLAAPA